MKPVTAEVASASRMMPRPDISTVGTSPASIRIKLARRIWTTAGGRNSLTARES
ncbi:MAG TPA: hypothetical protein VL172_11760 [Kofleriaceae bacterium]|nr:hypothetical protein [Kofleriaceae bacterium]